MKLDHTKSYTLLKNMYYKRNRKNCVNEIKKNMMHFIQDTFSENLDFFFSSWQHMRTIGKLKIVLKVKNMDYILF